MRVPAQPRTSHMQSTLIPVNIFKSGSLPSSENYFHLLFLLPSSHSLDENYVETLAGNKCCGCRLATISESTSRPPAGCNQATSRFLCKDALQFVSQQSVMNSLLFVWQSSFWVTIRYSPVLSETDTGAVFTLSFSHSVFEHGFVIVGLGEYKSRSAGLLNFTPFSLFFFRAFRARCSFSSLPTSVLLR